MTPEEMWRKAALAKGDKTRKQHPEQDLQIECVSWFDSRFPNLSIYLHHSPNGGSRNKVEAANFKRMGTRKGFPDLVFWLSYFDNETGKVEPMTFIEFKTDKGRQEPEQKAFEEAAGKVGVPYHIVRDKITFMHIVANILTNLKATYDHYKNLLPIDYPMILTEANEKMIELLPKEIKNEEIKQQYREQIQRKAKEARKAIKK